jgi:hypothetical protein
MLEILGTIATAVLGGGATGLFGVLIQRWADYKNRQQDIETLQVKQAHEVAMYSAQAAVMREEWAARTHIAEVDAQGKVDTAKAEAAGKEAEADAKAFAASYKLEPQSYSAGHHLSPRQRWVVVILDFVRGVIRPGLTVYLCYLTTLVYEESQRHVGALTAEQSFEILKLCIGTILYLFTTCTLWWFGTRNKQAAPGASQK